MISKYINNLKISRAKELLSSGMYTVTQAAEMSGYTDVSHFSREFKKATGAAPSMMMSSQPEI
ncbi:MAG: helix-turn-helix domain-containing protein [Lachnospiraceae bacterium]|nr:helix-turn-helix domain-containing protein [Lachnospiraceae bacterium]